MRIFIVTSSRADYGLLKPLIKRMVNDPFFDLKIIVTGTHLSAAYGSTISEIEDDGFAIFRKINIISVIFVTCKAVITVSIVKRCCMIS